MRVIAEYRGLECGRRFRFEGAHKPRPKVRLTAPGPEEAGGRGTPPQQAATAAPQQAATRPPRRGLLRRDAARFRARAPGPGGDRTEEAEGQGAALIALVAACCGALPGTKPGPGPHRGSRGAGRGAYCACCGVLRCASGHETGTGTAPRKPRGRARRTSTASPATSRTAATAAKTPSYCGLLQVIAGYCGHSVLGHRVAPLVATYWE